MIVLGAALNYGVDDVAPFWMSLRETGFKGPVVVISNDCEARDWLAFKGAVILDSPSVGHPINSSRFMVYADFLKKRNWPVLITDMRDVIFQKNLQGLMPTTGVNVFREPTHTTLGECPYNSRWMGHITHKWDDKPIICSGVTSGLLHDYCAQMWARLEGLPKIAGIDQAVHNDLIYSGLEGAVIHENNNGLVYNMAYVKLKDIWIQDDLILDPLGQVPCIVHQYDRHEATKELVAKLTKEAFHGSAISKERAHRYAVS